MALNNLLFKPMHRKSSRRFILAATLISCCLMVSVYYYWDFFEAKLHQRQEPPHTLEDCHYTPLKIEDKAYFDHAIQFVQNLATYSWITARTQFNFIRNQLLWETAKDDFVAKELNVVLQQIEKKQLSQLFVFEKKRVTLEDFPEVDVVVVRIVGRAYPFKRFTAEPSFDSSYYIKMTATRAENGESKPAIVDYKVR